MSVTKVEDYEIFDLLTEATNSVINYVTDAVSLVESKASVVNDESSFMGKTQEEAKKALEDIKKLFGDVTDAYGEVNTNVSKVNANYQNGNKEAAKNYIKAASGVTIKGAPPVAKVEYTRSIPNDVKQSGYTVTGYAKEGWQYTDYSTAKVAAKTNQEKVHNNWVAGGAKYKNGIAVTKVDGQDRYLIATSDYYGKVGDKVNVKLENGQTIPCIIADQKSNSDPNITKYGHSNGSSINVLEFEVSMKKFNESGNPTTSGWNLDWDSNSKVRSVDNLGSSI